MSLSNALLVGSRLPYRTPADAAARPAGSFPSLCPSSRIAGQLLPHVGVEGGFEGAAQVERLVEPVEPCAYPVLGVPAPAGVMSMVLRRSTAMACRSILPCPSMMIRIVFRSFPVASSGELLHRHAQCHPGRVVAFPHPVAQGGRGHAREHAGVELPDLHLI